MNSTYDIRNVSDLATASVLTIVACVLIKVFKEARARIKRDKEAKEAEKDEKIRQSAIPFAYFNWLEKKRALEDWLIEGHNARYGIPEHYQKLLHEELGAYMFYLWTIKPSREEEEYLERLLDRSIPNFVPIMPEWRRRV